MAWNSEPTITKKVDEYLWSYWHTDEIDDLIWYMVKPIEED